MQISVVVDGITFPKFAFEVGPSSDNCTEPSALKIVKSPLSRYVRVSVRPIVLSGFAADATAAASPFT